MVQIEVNRRIKERHPELDEEAVRQAWKNALVVAKRESDNLLEPFLVAVGFDSNGRLLEMVAVQRGSDQIHIFHAMTPPSKKTLKELGMFHGGRQ